MRVCESVRVCACVLCVTCVHILGVIKGAIWRIQFERAMHFALIILHWMQHNVRGRAWAGK